MKTTKLAAAIAVSASLALGVVAQAKEKKHEEESIKSSDVPAAVMKTAETEAKGGKIVRWEKEGADYEAVFVVAGDDSALYLDAQQSLHRAIAAGLERRAIRLAPPA